LKKAGVKTPVVLIPDKATLKWRCGGDQAGALDFLEKTA